jgi:hypothetical protein
MTDQFDPTQRGREPFDDPVTGDQTVPSGEDRSREAGGDAAASQAANAGMTSGLPGEIFAKPDADQPVEGRRDQPETDKALESERGREADADEATLGH